MGIQSVGGRSRARLGYIKFENIILEISLAHCTAGQPISIGWKYFRLYYICLDYIGLKYIRLDLGEAWSSAGHPVCSGKEIY